MKIQKKPFNSDAVSEIIGTQLLILITVGLFSIIYVSVLTIPNGDAPPSADIIIGVNGEDILFSNAGGEGLPLDTQIELIMDGETLTSFTVDEYLKEEYKDDNLWSYPESFIVTSTDLRGRDVNIHIIDIATNTLISDVTLDASNPLETRVNSIIPYSQTSSPLTISARSMGAQPGNVTLWYRHQWSWEDRFENDDLYVSMYHNMSFDDGNYVIVNRSGTGLIDYVDQLSNEDGSGDIGTHSDFNAQTDGPGQGANYDTLLEEDTGGSIDTVLINSESFEGSWLPTGWSESYNSNWNREGDEAWDGSLSADFDGWWWGTSGSLYSPVFDCSDATSMYLSFYFNVEVSQNNEFELYLRDDNDNWDNIDDLGNSPSDWNHIDYNIVDSQYFHEDFQIRWYARDVEGEEHIYLDYVYLTKEAGAPNFELDLEIQWASVDFSQPVETLCIYAIDIDTEDLRVEVWNTSSRGWDELFESLSVGWNNVSVTDWLTSSTFTIRYKDGSNVSDTIRDSWEIDSAYLYLVDPELDFSYQGNITSIGITKPDGTSWNTFYADVNNTDYSSFTILDDSYQVLKTGLDGQKNDISDLSDPTVILYGSFNGPVKLNNWNVSVEGGVWTVFDTDDNDPWTWIFDFPDGEGLYSFYSIAKREGWYDEPAPSGYDTTCFYDSLGG